MATKKSTSASTKSAKPAKTTKTKPTPKPTTKPASTSVKPKQHKTTKASATSAKSNNKNVIAYIVGAVAAVALIVIGIIALATSINNGGRNSLTVKDGDGNKITTEYLGFDDFNFRLKIPTSFHAMSTDDIIAKYGKDNAPKTVYSNSDNTVNIAISPTDSTVTNDQVKTYLNTAKSVFNVGGEILADDYFTQGNHNIATLQLVTMGQGGTYYNNMIFFSQNDKLTMVTFNCKYDEREKWQPVGTFILKSIDFTK